MEERIKNYIESVFRGVPQTEHSESIKNEILQNLLDKYHDLKNEGRNDEEAYAIAISSGGDLSDIVADLKSRQYFGREDSSKNTAKCRTGTL